MTGSVDWNVGSFSRVFVGISEKNDAFFGMGGVELYAAIMV